MHRDFVIPVFCCALLASSLASAADEPRGAACVQGSEANPVRMIEDCNAMLRDKTTPEAKVPGIFLARAEAFVRQGQVKRAIDDLGDAIARRPDHAAAFLKRADLQRSLGESEAAIRDFSAAIRLEPANAGALFARAELYRARTDRRRALADYAAVLRLEPANEAASANHKALALEIERLGAMMPVQQTSPPQHH